jgi:DTW domain-containing protein YfiP
MRPFQPKEFKVIALRECPVPEEMCLCDTPEKAAGYWRLHVVSSGRSKPATGGHFKTGQSEVRDS